MHALTDSDAGSVALTIFNSRLETICDEMGGALMRAAFSANIKDRRDFSCALFTQDGHLLAQAAHIPVHLGSMAYAMRDLVDSRRWQEGDVVVLNDPFLGGTHLPDVTLIQPVFIHGELAAFVANRAHHANIGASAPGSMPISSSIHEEGLVIPPMALINGGEVNRETCAHLGQLAREESCDNNGESGLHQIPLDFLAQLSACRLGERRLVELLEELGKAVFDRRVSGLFEYARQLSSTMLQHIPETTPRVTDYLDSDGQGQRDVAITLRISRLDDQIVFNFDGTSDQVKGNLNCPLSVTAAAVYYAVKCLLPPEAPTCDGSFSCIRLCAPEGSLLNANFPAAVAAGNVETSTRVVDLVFSALAECFPERVPAQAQGTMNNVAMGSASRPVWDYYETIGGGMGGGPRFPGLSAVQTHLTNTLNTPIESVEMHYPLRIREYALRPDSGGPGLHPGGNGIVRVYEFLEEAQVTLLTERRRHAPSGLRGGESGEPGANLLNQRQLADKVSFTACPGDELRIATPGGGGWGRVRESS